MEAALTLFLRQGYRETTTDEIAALAGVSKRTIYHTFPDKENLFDTLVRGSIERAQSFLDDTSFALGGASDLRSAMQSVALKYVDTVFQSHVLQLRRLVISEANRFPELALSYYRQVPGRTIDSLAEDFRQLSKKGALRANDPGRMAQHFAALLIEHPLDMAMFGALTPIDELRKAALDGVDAFLAAYAAK